MSIATEGPGYDTVHAASRSIDRILLIGQEMSVSPSKVRLGLLEEARGVLSELHALNTPEFSSLEILRGPSADLPPLQATIHAALTDLEAALEKLAALNNGQIPENHRASEGVCVVCQAPIHQFNPLPRTLCAILKLLGIDCKTPASCLECSEIFMPALTQLRSTQCGFGTDMI